MGLQAFETQNGPKSLVGMDLWVNLSLMSEMGDQDVEKESQQALIHLLISFG